MNSNDKIGVVSFALEELSEEWTDFERVRSFPCSQRGVESCARD